MERLVDLIAPRSRADFVLRAIVFITLINLFDVVVARSLGGDFDMTVQVIQNSVVAAPFVALALGVIAHLRTLQTRLTGLAATDVLTGLRNRRAFLADAARSHAQSGQGVLLLLDADFFKHINDNHGHNVGDICLKSIADRMRALVRKDDVIGRLGGEEFAIYLPNGTPEMAAAVGKRLCEGVEMAPPEVENRFQLTLSAGAVTVRKSDTIEKMITIADRSLYEAKETGRARLVFAAITEQVNLPTAVRRPAT